MNKTICVSGDSFTQEYLQKHEDRWSTQIGATHNIAMGGAGNELIFNTTIEFLNHTIPEVLIVGWSDTVRGLLHHCDGTKLIVSPHRCFVMETNEDHEDIKDFYYKNLYNEYVNFKNTLTYMLFLQEYCKARQIKLLYFRSVMSEKLDQTSLMEVSESAYMVIDNPDMAKQEIKNKYYELITLIDKLDKEIWLKEFWYSMSEHINKKFPGQIKTGYARELPAQAVKDWAELVKKYL